MEGVIDYETLVLLNRQKWEDVLLYVEAAVIKMLRLTPDSDDLPSGFQPQDLAFEAMTSLYAGTRKWDHQRYPDVAKFMVISIIRSKLNHLFNSSDNKMITRMVEEVMSGQDDYDGHPQTTENSQTAAFSFEEEFLLEDMVGKVLAGLAGDKIATEVFKLRMESCKDQEVAKMLEISVNDVRAANKRIARIGQKMLPKGK